MAGKRKLSLSSLAVLRVMMDAPSEAYYGLDISKRAELASGTVYPILRRFEQQKWVTSRNEDVDPAQAGRPRRRLYELTGLGAQVAQSELVRTQRRFGWLPQAVPGV